MTRASKAPAPPRSVNFKPTKRIKTPSVLQMQAVECGAASLSMILRYYGRFVPLEELRAVCGVSRDGVKASAILRAARSYGLVAKGYRKELHELADMPLPAMLFWNFNHFVVLEGLRRDRAFINDPAMGPRVVPLDEFDEAFTGVVLTFEPGDDFTRLGSKPSLLSALGSRLKSSRMAMIFVVLISLALVIPGLLVPAFVQIFVDNILVQGQNWLPALLAGMAGTALIRFLLVGMQQYYLLRLETKIALATSSRFMWHVLRLPIEFFTQRYAGDVSSRVQINDRVAHLLSGELATAVLNLVLVVFYTLLLYLYSPLLTVIGIGIALLNIVVLQYVARRRVDANNRLLQERSKLVGAAMNGLVTIETVKATGAESDLFARLAGYHTKALNAEQQFNLLSQVLSVFPVFLTTVNTTVILFVGGLSVMDGALTVGSLVAFQTLMTSFITPFNQIVNLGGRFQQVEGDMNRLDDVLAYDIDDRVEFLDLEQQASSAEKAPADGPMRAKLSGWVALRDITFGYNRLSPPLIEGFSLTVEPGSRVALVGGSGSGKSTIAKLVAGLYEPWEGEILFDGVRRQDWSRDLIANSVSMVDQDLFMFEGSIRDNITLWDATVPEMDIIQAAKDASIHPDIAERPNGYDSLVEEGGRNFSGGQLQRIEIARALVGNPSLLILDEATSALDPVTEKHIDDNLRRRGCTCLIVAHRLSTIRDCDEIIVLDGGQVVQRGTHDEMKDIDGPYRDLIRAEAYETEKSRAFMEYLY